MNKCRVIATEDCSCTPAPNPGYTIVGFVCEKFRMKPLSDDECREMFTRRCPGDGCEGLPCARFEDDDPFRHVERIET